MMAGLTAMAATVASRLVCLLMLLLKLWWRPRPIGQLHSSSVGPVEVSTVDARRLRPEPPTLRALVTRRHPWLPVRSGSASDSRLAQAGEPGSLLRPPGSATSLAGSSSPWRLPPSRAAGTVPSFSRLPTAGRVDERCDRTAHAGRRRRPFRRRGPRGAARPPPPDL